MIIINKKHLDQSQLTKQENFFQVAFWGKSNVGKSSLINSLLKSKLARSSKTPGCTQTITWFPFRDNLMLVDFPGYGYAQAPLGKIGLWNRHAKKYIVTHPKLMMVFLLVDGRHGSNSTDKDAMKWLCEQGASFQIVLTKCETKEAIKNSSSVEKSVMEDIDSYPTCAPTFVKTDATNVKSLSQIKSTIENLLNLWRS